MKPDWKDAPEWAKFLAQDSDGDWWWYEFKPNVSNWVWVPINGGQWELAELSCNDLWKETLQSRPE